MNNRHAPLPVVQPLEPRALLAAELAADVGTATTGSNPTAFVTLGDAAYFFTDDATNLQSLYRTDGTPAGTTLVKGGLRRLSGFYTRSLAAVNGRLYFFDLDANSQPELWTSDGTAAGTEPFAQFSGGAPNFNASFTSFAGKVFFIARDTTAGTELWSTDGTPAGTARVADFRAGSQSSDPQALTVSGQYLYFVTTGAGNVRTLQRTDGVTVTPLRSFGTQAASSMYPTDVDGTLFFVGAGAEGRELWKSDGTPEGTILIKDLRPGTTTSSSPRGLLSLNGTLVFNADDGDGGGLWASDGTAGGTVELRNVIQSESRLMPLGDIALFFEYTNVSGHELWRTDGTAAGTYLFTELAPGSQSALHPYDLLYTRSGTVGYFAAPGMGESGGGLQIWHTDGTPTGTRFTGARTLFPNIDPATVGPIGTPLPGGRVVFPGRGPDNDLEPWVSDGTPAGTFKLKDINTTPAASKLTSIIDLNGTALFAYNGDLYRSDGTPGGTSFLADVTPLGYSLRPTSVSNGPAPVYAVTHGVAVFAAETGASSSAYTLWRSDGTPGGTYPLKSLPVRPNDYLEWDGNAHGPFVTYNGDVYFISRDGSDSDWEIWKTDGTTDGTVRVTNLAPQSSTGAGADQLFANHDGVYFAYNPGVQVQLWRTRGTPGDATFIQGFGDVDSGWGRSITKFATAGPNLLFTVDVVNAGIRQYVTDGTTAGTRPLDAVRVETLPVTLPNGLALFTARDPAVPFGYRYYRSDGTVEGTVPFSDVYPAPNGKVLVHGDHVYFSAAGELWRTDGTAAGTTRFAPRTGNRLVAWRGAIYFTRDRELWRTDGTDAGTVLDATVGAPGLFDPAIDELRVVGDQLFFAATRPDVGRELFRVVDEVAPRPTSSGYEWASRPAVSVTFPEAVTDLDPAMVVLTRGGAAVPPSTYALAWNPQSDRLELRFPAAPEDGDYRLTLLPGAVRDRAGNPLATEVTVDFFHLAGDANHDRAVDFLDLTVLAQNYARTEGATFDNGDFNYDGSVDFADLALLAQRYNTSLAAPPAPPALPSEPAPADAAALFSTTPVPRVPVAPNRRVARR